MGLSSPAALSGRALAWLLCHLSPVPPDTSLVLLSQQILLQLETFCSEHSSPEQVPPQQEGSGRPCTSWKYRRFLFLLYLLGRQECIDSSLSITETICPPENSTAQTPLIGLSQKMKSSIMHDFFSYFFQPFGAVKPRKPSSCPVTESQTGWCWKGPQ